MASSSSSRLQVPPEALNLSASTFTSAIDSWIPAGWGAKRSEKDRAAEFDKALRAAALEGEADKLGVGHPDIGKPRSKGPSLSVLEKRLGKVDKKVNRNSQDADIGLAARGGVDVDEDEDQEESRARSVASSKRKNALPDFLSGKKKGKAKATNANAGNPNPIRPLLNLGLPSDDDDEDDLSPRTPPTAATSSPGGSGVFPFTGPVALESPQAKRIIDDGLMRKRLRDEDETLESPGGSLAGSGSAQGEESASQEKGTGTMSKSQKRREHRKRMKLAKANGE